MMMNKGEIIIAVFAVIILLAVFLITYFRMRRGKKEMELRQDILTQQLEVWKKKQDLINYYKEELRKSTAGLQTNHMQLAYGTERAEYVNKVKASILRDMETDEEVHWWKQTVLDSVFRQKLMECEEKKITVVTEGFPAEGLNCAMNSVMEQIALFANLFDNAMEACMLIPDDRERWIHICAEQSKKKLTIMIENSCNEFTEETERKRTWKTDKENHGIGTEIIQDIVMRQKGRILFKQNKDRFLTELILPVA